MRSTTPVGAVEHHLAPHVRGVSARHGVRSCGHAETRPTTAAAVVEQVVALHDALLARPHLAPEPATNELFGRLVALAVDPAAARDADAVLGDPTVARLLASLRHLCADGEFELERSWARRVVDHPDPGAELARFPYHQNYGDLTRLEHHTVAGLTASPVRRVLFIGSGPLPLTSLLLAEHSRVRGRQPRPRARRGPSGRGPRGPPRPHRAAVPPWRRPRRVRRLRLGALRPGLPRRPRGPRPRRQARAARAPRPSAASGCARPRPQRPLPARAALPRPRPRRPARPAHPRRRAPAHRRRQLGGRRGGPGSHRGLRAATIAENPGRGTRIPRSTREPHGYLKP